MNCLKCGKEIPLGRVFCDGCQQDMDNFPVDPGTPVVIPPRPESRAEQRRKRRGYADTIRTYQKLIRWLCAALAVTLLIVCVLAGCLYYTFNKYNDKNIIGKNYTAIESSEPS